MVYNQQMCVITKYKLSFVLIYGRYNKQSPVIKSKNTKNVERSDAIKDLGHKGTIQHFIIIMF